MSNPIDQQGVETSAIDQQQEGGEISEQEKLNLLVKAIDEADRREMDRLAEEYKTLCGRDFKEGMRLFLEEFEKNPPDMVPSRTM